MFTANPPGQCATHAMRGANAPIAKGAGMLRADAVARAALWLTIGLGCGVLAGWLGGILLGVLLWGLWGQGTGAWEP